MVIKRLPAKKVRISDIINGRFFYGDKETLKPSFVITKFGQTVARVNLIGNVIDKFLREDGNYATITIDDGTDSISVRAFNEGTELLKKINFGDMVIVIGKIKEYNGERYLNAEIVRKVEDVNIESFRRLEILKDLIKLKKVLADVKNQSEKMSEEELFKYVKQTYSLSEEELRTMLESKKTQVDYKPKILEVIKRLDEGNGVELGKIFEISKLPEHVMESAITEMLNNGILYEPRPNVLRVV